MVQSWGSAGYELEEYLELLRGEALLHCKKIKLEITHEDAIKKRVKIGLTWEYFNYQKTKI